eukprot:TRINITY_DN5250_c0_g1_i14.p1 TRINITY_DN5250_c0_g1~~TRINITY_DN5250_c0_g1_i14.p1  ORF type:complete len:110 (+),score=26.90 TRINITY_DN5250_c0_g1_i14:73-402(+)
MCIRDSVKILYDTKSLIISIDKDALEDPKKRAKEEWKRLPEKTKKQYKIRLATEKHIKAYLRNTDASKKFIPSNKYGKFVKKYMEENEIKTCSKHFLYEVFQQWLEQTK